MTEISPNGGLASAAKAGDIAGMRYYRARGATDYDLAMHCAAEAGSLEALRQSQAWGATLYDWACAPAAENGHLAVLQQLRVWGADLATVGMLVAFKRVPEPVQRWYADIEASGRPATTAP